MVDGGCDRCHLRAAAFLVAPLASHTLLDDVLAPMRVVLAGKRIVFDERARAFDCAASHGIVETRRKTRTLAGNYQILALEPRLLLPFANPVWVQYVSHKIGRLLAPWALIGAFLTSAVLAADHWFFAVALILQLGFYGLAAIGGWIDFGERNRTVSGHGLPHAEQTQLRCASARGLTRTEDSRQSRLNVPRRVFVRRALSVVGVG